jgi:hypothetical protein
MHVIILFVDDAARYSTGLCNFLIIYNKLPENICEKYLNISQYIIMVQE